MRDLFVLVVCLAGCPSPSISSKSNAATTEITVGAERMTIDGCYSGQMLQFRGVDLFGGGELTRRVRVIDDPVAGFRVVLLGFADKPRVVIDASGCTKFEATVRGTNSYLNEVREMEGSLKLDCPSTAVGKVAADVSFSGCSFNNRAN